VWPGKRSHKGYGRGTQICGLTEDQHEEHRRPDRDLAGEQGERGATWRDGAQRGECAHGGCVDQEEGAETADADAGILEHFAAPVGAAVDHQGVADVEYAVGVVQAGGEKHGPQRERGGYTGGHDGGSQ
jgi:hypothetical protein